MGTPAKFRFSFKTGDDTQWYYLNGSTVATSSAPKYFLDDTGTQMISPKDWKALQVGMARNEKYHGVFTKFGLPMSFTFQAKQICEYVFATEGSEGSIVFVVEIWDSSKGLYRQLIKGDLDLSTTEDADLVNEKYYRTNIAERSWPEKLKAQENIPQEIPFDSDYLTIRHDGVVLDMKYLFVSAYRFEDRGNADYFVPITEIKHEGGIESLIVSPTSIGDLTDANNLFKNNVWFIPVYDIIADGNINFNIDGGLFNQSTNPVTFIMEIFIFRNNDFSAAINAGNTEVYKGSPVPNNTLSGITFNVDYPFDFQKGDYVCVTAGITDLGSGGQQYDIDIKETSRITVTGKYRLPETEIKTFRYFTFLEKLFKKALGDSISVRSDYLSQDQDYKLNYDNNPKWTTVASGSSVRRRSDAKIKTTISDAHQDMRRWGLGLAIEYNTIRIERYPYFYQKDRVVIVLENIKNFKFYSANDYLGNIVNVGYNSQTYDDVNGLQDFHGKTTFQFPIARNKKEIDLVSPYYGSIFALEYARAMNFEKESTTDSQYDDQIYLIEVNGDPATYTNGKPNLYRPAGYKYGLLNPDSAFNWGLTPYNTLLFNRELLLAMAYGKPLASGLLEFKTASKNPNVSRYLNSIQVDEDATHSLKYFMRRPTGTPATPTGDLVTPLFQPVIFEYDAYIPENAIELMNSDVQNRYGVIDFPHPGGARMRNFILDIAAVPATDDLYTVRGLSSPDNDLLNLVSKW